VLEALNEALLLANVARQAIEALDQEHLELASARRAFHVLVTRPFAGRATDRLVLVMRDDFPPFGDRTALAVAALVLA
jgi:hypothetical protein